MSLYDVVDFLSAVCLVGLKSSWQVHHLATDIMATSPCIKRNRQNWAVSVRTRAFAKKKKKKNLKWAQQTNILFLSLSLSLKTIFFILFLQLYSLLCLRPPPFIHLPCFLSSTNSPENWVPLVLFEQAIVSKLISKESCEPLYGQCVVVW